MTEQELDCQREEGLRRYRIIAPLLEDDLAECEKRQARRLMRSREGISARTLRRYVAAFKRKGFDGLLPGERQDKGRCKAIPPEALEMAAELRRKDSATSGQRRFYGGPLDAGTAPAAAGTQRPRDSVRTKTGGQPAF